MYVKLKYGVIMEIDIDETIKEMSDYLVENGATNVVMLDVEKKTKTAKRLVIATAKSSQFAKTLALSFKEHFSKQMLCIHSDGLFKGDWIVLDFKDIIVHIFTKDTRNKFNLEKLYKDSKNFITIPNARKVVKK